MISTSPLERASPRTNPKPPPLDLDSPGKETNESTKSGSGSPSFTGRSFKTNTEALLSLQKCLEIHEKLFSCKDVTKVPLLVIEASQSIQDVVEATSVARSLCLEAATAELEAEVLPLEPATSVGSPTSQISFQSKLSSSTPPPVKIVAIKKSPTTYSNPATRIKYDTTMPSPLARLTIFRQNLKDMINGKQVGTTPVMPPASPSILFSSPNMNLSSRMTSNDLNESMFGETHEIENKESFSRLQNLNHRVASIQEELTRIVSGQSKSDAKSYAPPLSTAT
jgi:hypothetical protein